MRVAATVAIGCAFLFAGCHTAEKVGVTTFHVIDAPANYIRHQIDGDQTTTTTTTTTSDVTNPGRPVTVNSPPPRRTTSESRIVTSQPPRSTTTAPRTSASPATRTVQQQAQAFPTAKPVPGKPGFVISPFDPNGGYVDVTGYASGSKAKDPYSQKIFIVP